jgi:hypothetical protein
MKESNENSSQEPDRGSVEAGEVLAAMEKTVEAAGALGVEIERAKRLLREKPKSLWTGHFCWSRSRPATPGGGDVPTACRQRYPACNDNGSFFRRRGHSAPLRPGILESASETAGTICLSYVAQGVFLMLGQEPALRVRGRWSMALHELCINAVKYGALSEGAAFMRKLDGAWRTAGRDPAWKRVRITPDRTQSEPSASGRRAASLSIGRE